MTAIGASTQRDATEWTIVGVIGQLGRQTPPNSKEIVNPDSSVNRAKVVDLVAGLLHGAAGLVDLPSGDGFSVVPFAVYRSLGALDDSGSGVAENVN